MKQLIILSLLLLGQISFGQEKEIIIERNVEEMLDDKPFVGLVVEAFDYKTSDIKSVRGVLVKQVVTGEAAYNAGIEEGDVITAINNIETPSPSLFSDAVKQLEPREEVTFTYYRGKSKETAEALVGIKSNDWMFGGGDNIILHSDGNNILRWNDDELKGAILGLRDGQSWFQDGNIIKLEDMDLDNLQLDLQENFDFDFNFPKAQLGVSIEEVEEGAKITKVNKDSAASKAKLEKGDIITGINGKDIEGTQELIDTIAEMDVDDEVEIEYLRKGKKKKTKAKLQEYSAGTYRFIYPDREEEVIIEKD